MPVPLRRPSRLTLAALLAAALGVALLALSSPPAAAQAKGTVIQGTAQFKWEPANVTIKPGEGHQHGRPRREQGGVGHQHALVQRQRLQRAAVAQPQAAQLGRGGEGEQRGHLAGLAAAEAARLDRHHRGGGGRAGHHHHDDEAPEPWRQHRRRGPRRHTPCTRVRRGLGADCSMTTSGSVVVTTEQVRTCQATRPTRARRRAQVRPALGAWRAGAAAGRGRPCGRCLPAPRWWSGGGSRTTVTDCTG